MRVVIDGHEIQEAVQVIIPDHIIAALVRYVKYRVPIGDFLRAVLENDLRGAVGRADSENCWRIPAIVSYCYNDMPAVCWGSPEKVVGWLEDPD